MRLYDTRLREVKGIEPADGKCLTIYACGPTVYRYAHVGNLRTFLLLDLITRLAHLQGVSTKVVQNITDVGHLVDDSNLDPEGEDKILQQAKSEGKDPLTIARFYEEAFHADLAELNILPADHYPRASESIDLIIDICQRLQTRGHAYVGSDGSLFFDARTFAGYGAISGNSLDQLKPGQRLEGKSNDAKRFHADWALWKSAGAGREMTWDSPWGWGFPGWHIECSAMSLDHFGEEIDLHLGGIDLRFPHHEDERAQSNSSVTKASASQSASEVVKHWVHGEHLLFEGRKMSKSSGNVVMVGDLRERGFDPLALRLTFLEARYRTQLDLSWEAISAAHKTLVRWRHALRKWGTQGSDRAMPAILKSEGLGYLEDDLNTPALIQLLRRIEKDPSVNDETKGELFRYFDQFLALDLDRVEKRSLSEAAVELLAKREKARDEKNWSESDQLRDSLSDLGIEVRDVKTGQEWQWR